ncbi:MAG: anti-sigma factor family protein [Planctomycetota bacterium]|jgi:hypothetical protein
MKLTNAQSSLEFDCQDTLEIMDLYVVFSDELTASERNDAAEHMLACEACRNEYLEIKLTDTALRVNRDWLKESGVFGSSETDISQVEISEKEIAKLRFEAMMDRALTRRKRRERKERIAKIKRIAMPISDVAACLIIALGIWGVIADNNPGQTSPQQPVAINPTEIPVKIELLSDSGTKNIPASHPIIAISELKTLRINGNRQMILNMGTELSIVPHNLGCIVKLDKGEIYTEVEHDGKPFIVETIHGPAVITGTIFNIKADYKQMELTVIEGTVRFEGNKSKVNVTAGHKLRLALNRKPSLPLPCNTKQLTAWATGINKTEEIVATTTYQPDFDLPLSFDNAEIDLESIDYATWIEQKRSWFKQEFPHIFKFKEALVKEGIEADYPELLIKSGDLWRFVFPEKTNTQLIPANFESMLKLASAYDKDAQWLKDYLHVNAANLISETETSSLKAFERWINALEESLDSPLEVDSKLLCYSLHSSSYLINTRTITWLAITNNDQLAITAIEKEEVTTLLEQEIKAANYCTNQFKQLFSSSYSSSTCDGDKQREALLGIIENIEEMRIIEKQKLRHIFSTQASKPTKSVR